MIKWLRLAVAQQLNFVSILWHDRRFCSAMVALWSADFGGSIHSPATTFYFLLLGATPMDIGILEFGRRLSCIVLSPVYGRLVDKHGLYWPLLACVSMCGTGCILRGTAQDVWHLFLAQLVVGMGGGAQWTMTKGYISGHLEESQRSLIVVGLRVQMTVLSFSGLLYPLLDWALRDLIGLKDQLLRYRGVIATCSIFCWLGIAILGCGSKDAKIPPASESSASSNLAFDVSKNSFDFKFFCGNRRFAAASFMVGAVVCGQSMAMTLWPIFIKHNFGWEANAFAYLGTAHKLLLTISLTGYNSAAGSRLGQSLCLQALTGAAFVMLSAFAVRGHGTDSGVAPATHAIFSVICLACLWSLAAGAEAAASLCIAGDAQGWAMGFLGAVASLGFLSGSLLGPLLWTLSLDGDSWGPLAGGRLPFAIIGLLLVGTFAALRLLDFQPLGGVEEEKQAFTEVEASVLGASSAGGPVFEIGDDGLDEDGDEELLFDPEGQSIQEAEQAMAT